MSSEPATRTSGRYASLDGLRGLAAFVVVLSHGVLVAPSLSHALLHVRQSPAGSLSWWLTYTPLHFFWMGGEAVLVFFVLSGFVLTLPSASGRAAGWDRYYPQRLLRLYLPLAGAVVLAGLLVLVKHRGPDPRASDWLSEHPSHFTFGDMARDAFVLHGTDNLNSALWSLQWEMIFSIALPLFVVVFVRWRGQPMLKAGLLLLSIVGSGHLDPALSVFGISLRGAFTYLPIFGLGALLAQERVRLFDLARRFDDAGRLVRMGVVGVFVVLMFGFWAESAVHSASATGLSVARAGQVVASCMLVVFFAATRTGTAVGTGKTVHWLGVRSFSLYLVHEPIIVTVAYLLGGTHNAGLVLLIGVPVALLVAELFYRLVEHPAHLLAQRVGRSVAERQLRGKTVHA